MYVNYLNLVLLETHNIIFSPSLPKAQKSSVV